MENKEAYIEFLNTWNDAMWYAFLAALAVAALIFIIYKIRYMSAGGYKEKFEFASEKEIKAYLLVNYAIAAGIFFIANSAKPQIVEISYIWFIIRVFISMCLGTLHAYVAFLIFKYYYPGPLDKKLKKLRYKPRINPATGNEMKLLSEAEEDAYLDEGMQAEEDAFSVDYDVWIDEATGDTKIEKYKGHLSALECDRCGFQTLKLEKEEIITPATEDTAGEIQKEYKCSYCGRIKRKTMKLTTKLEKEDILAALSKGRLAGDNQIELIRIEIQSMDGETKSFEFQNRDEAKKFLEEFDFSKLRQTSY
ncbi:hypothetical protein [Marinoscillum sp. MHG1-6]|uniref:hypothetical protein n=1 Tax=Marinoscillum sp. MHG1-6 TaxID=2959627 RepID=UPI002157BBAA|nr:hypothetical protein [Marinoscillum sp. MHG1-6]